MALVCIQNGEVYDPINGVNGQVRDIWIEDGRIVSPPPGRRADRTYDATGMVVMPAGVDLHAHIVGPKVNMARKLRPEEKRHAVIPRSPTTRSGTLGSVPSTFATGYKYAALGYGTVFDAAIPPLSARHAHEELHDTPIIDKGFYVLMGNNHFVLQQIRDRNPELLRAFVAWLLDAAKGYAVKLVNPGGVEEWKLGGGNVTDVHEPIDYFNVSPADIIRQMALVVQELGLPHPVHIHCNNLGIPGNADTTLATMQVLDGIRAHLTHIQFHSYGGSPDDPASISSRAPELVQYVNEHPNLSIDVGQVLFGDTTSMTGDSPLGYYLHRVTGRKWFSGDVELESGCGIVPIRYRPRSLVHAVQWACGLEWFLLAEDPWRVVLSTDHPNGGSFLAYPQLIKYLMSETARREVIERLPERVRERTVLRDLSREYTLYEIAIITRAAPAQIAGLDSKGHLGPGADADIVVYRKEEDYEQMFAFPRWVFRMGELIVDDGEIRREMTGETLFAEPSGDPDALPVIRQWFEDHYTVRFANYAVGREYLGQHARAIPCRGNGHTR